MKNIICLALRAHNKPEKYIFKCAASQQNTQPAQKCRHAVSQQENCEKARRRSLLMRTHCGRQEELDISREEEAPNEQLFDDTGRALKVACKLQNQAHRRSQGLRSPAEEYNLERVF